MKHTTKPFGSIFVFVVLMATCLAGASKISGSSHRAFDGYYRDIKTGQTFDNWYCGQFIYIYLRNADDEITIGKSVWADLSLTTPFPNGIITSYYGSTYGQSFYVLNGVIYDYATPMNCWDPLTDGK
ncbi:hypothetical protein [Sediminibacterium ginsengisoli]|uniref:Uncharacterized protein n=1 Tax=Sediminibacterium ginsengisoli TaxID=413434 RepID=A0A1T4NGP2_9BACT|nr:hypothetical protein [Sediminibacterium ginsengisoli]SJZ78531.1 hypothetical protein SAMN04488132_104254 [Sediminibacterium ginsengisoli]